MADLSTLTARQKEIFEFIREKIESRGYGPTVREIGEAFAIESPNGVMCHLKALEKKGLLSREAGKARAITLAGYKAPDRGLPLLGSVAAGPPTEAIESPDRVDVNEMLGGANHFVLRVNGTSMIDDHIADGDYVVIRKQETANNGDRVVAMIDNEVTLKRYYRDKAQVRLEPANPTMQPIFLDPSSESRILGVLVGVFRRC